MQTINYAVTRYIVRAGLYWTGEGWTEDKAKAKPFMTVDRMPPEERAKLHADLMRT